MKEQKALEYANRNNIKDYKVKGNRMIYYANNPDYLCTTKVTVRLDTMEEKRQKLNKWIQKGNANMYK